MSDNTNPNWAEVEQLLQLFYPQYFDVDSPHYVDPIILAQLDVIAMDARPWCLSANQQNYAEALYLAYLVSLRAESSAGIQVSQVSGPVTSEKEGDIAITYADTTSNPKASLSQRPASDPWDAWNRLWMRCQRGAITTRFGDPVSAQTITQMLSPRALAIWGTV